MMPYESNGSLTYGNTDFFEIVAGVLWVDSLAPYVFILCQDYVLQICMKLIKKMSSYKKKHKVGKK